jgi:hypothetical protein
LDRSARFEEQVTLRTGFWKDMEIEKIFVTREVSLKWDIGLYGLVAVIDEDEIIRGNGFRFVT